LQCYPTSLYAKAKDRVMKEVTVETTVENTLKL